MKKFIVLIIMALAYCFVGGCDSVSDSTNIVFYFTYNNTFNVSGDSATYSYDIDLSEDDNYQRYENNITDIEITYLKYSILSNSGGAGTGILYAGGYGSSFATAAQVAETVSFSASETRGDTDIVWTDKNLFESLLATGKLSIWAAGSGADVHIVLPTELKLRITANPLD